MESMLLPLRRYADFSGRSARKEYWMFVLFIWLICLVPSILLGVGMASVGNGSGSGGGLVTVAFGLLGLFFLAILIPAIAVQVRRFHDQDKSGWFVLLGLIPYLGGLIVLVFMCLEGTRGPNRYGPDPRDPNNVNVFA